jgi:hypothetical protein
MKNVLKSTLFGAALLVAAAGFAQSSTSPQKGDEDRTPNTPPVTSSTDTNSTGSVSGTSGSTSGTAGTTGTTGTSGSYGTTGTTGTTGTMGATGAAGSTMTRPGSYSGTVQTLNAGQTLVITTANGETQTFDLSNSPALASSVAVGSRVRIKQKVDKDGKTIVTVVPYR